MGKSLVRRGSTLGAFELNQISSVLKQVALRLHLDTELGLYPCSYQSREQMRLMLIHVLEGKFTNGQTVAPLHLELGFLQASAVVETEAWRWMLC